MKKLLFICSVLLFAGMGYAQTPAAAENSPEGNDNTNHKVTYKGSNEFAGTEMSFREGEVIFSGLPECSRPVWAVVTNTEGESVKQMKISPQNNVMNVRSLHAGRLYFVTIMYKDKSKKAFTLNM